VSQSLHEARVETTAHERVLRENEASSQRAHGVAR